MYNIVDCIVVDSKRGADFRRIRDIAPAGHVNRERTATKPVKLGLEKPVGILGFGIKIRHSDHLRYLLFDLNRRTCGIFFGQELNRHCA